MVVSDTVRLRRARTPSNSGESSNGRAAVTTAGAMNLPDLLPNTFRLAEQSSLFSSLNDEESGPRQRSTNDNYLNGKSWTVSTPQVSHITLEKVQYFEPEHAETVNIVDLSEDNASDTSDTVEVPVKRADVLKLKSERMNSFYETDMEGHEEPLVFSEDEDTEFEANMVH